MPTRTKRYIEVPAGDFHLFLTGRGFVQGARGGERIYKRTGKMDKGGNPLLSIIVFSSIAISADEARKVGEDAIRTVLIARVHINGQEQEWPLHKCKRVYRTGTVAGVLERTWERIEECAKVAGTRYGLGACAKCGSPTFKSGACIVRTCRESR